MNLRRCEDGCEYLKDLAECAEYPVLKRMAATLGHIFQVPVAYIALLGHGTDIAKRIGSGARYWPFLKELPKAAVLGKPFVVRDSADWSPPGLQPKDLRFIATTPLHAADGLQIGAVIIAAREPRPGFSDRDLEALAAFGELLASKIELRTIACHAMESELSHREAERRFHAIADSAPVPMSYSDANGACVFVNQAWLDFTGRSMGDELGDGWLDPVHPEHRARIRKAFWTAFQARQPFQDKALVRRFDGQYRWVLGQVTPRFREDGSFGGVVGALSDITDAYTAALELRKQKQCSDAMSASLGALYFMLDLEGRIEQMCPQAETLTPPDEFDLRGQFLWNAIPDADPSIRWAVQRSVQSRTPVALDSSGRRWAMMPLTSHEGEVVGLCVSLTDR